MTCLHSTFADGRDADDFASSVLNVTKAFRTNCVFFLNSVNNPKDFSSQHLELKKLLFKISLGWKRSGVLYLPFGSGRCSPFIQNASWFRPRSYLGYWETNFYCDSKRLLPFYCRTEETVWMKCAIVVNNQDKSGFSPAMFSPWKSTRLPFLRHVLEAKFKVKSSSTTKKIPLDDISAFWSSETFRLEFHPGCVDLPKFSGGNWTLAVQSTVTRMTENLTS